MLAGIRIVLGFMLLSLALDAEPLELEVSAVSALVLNLETGAILYEKNSDQQRYPASITKVATALYAIAENSEFLDEVVEIEWDDVASISTKAKRESKYSHPAHWLETGATHMGLKVGERLTVRELLHGMLVVSANDAANAIARYLGGSVPNYMDDLNDYLKQLGCMDSHFMNPSGLHHPRQYTTAWDMGVILGEAMRYQQFRDIVAMGSWKRPKTNKQDETTLAQGNKLMRRGKYYYHRCKGGKTGYTSDAKNTFVVTAEKGGRMLATVFMGCESRDTMFLDTINVFETAFNEVEVSKTIVERGRQPYVLSLDNASRAIHVCTAEAVELRFFPSEEPQLKAEIDWRDDLELPLAAKEEVGVLRIIGPHGQEVASQLLYADHAVNLAWVPWLRQSGFADGLSRGLGLACMAGLVFALGFRLRRT